MDKYLVIGVKEEQVYLAELDVEPNAYITVNKDFFLFDPQTGDVAELYRNKVNEKEIVFAYAGNEDDLW